MRVLDTQNNEVSFPDLSLGYLKEDKIFVRHHPAIKFVEEQWHYETIAIYPNGGKDVKRVVDVAGVEAQEAWDEYEDILRYVLYTPEELEELGFNKPTAEERIAVLEEALEMILSGVTE